MAKWKMINVFNPYCKRECFLAVDIEYEKRGKSVEDIYNNSYFFSFDLKRTSREVIKHNLKENNTL